MAQAMFDLARIAADSGIASLEFQPEVGSTNDWALALAADAERSWPLLALTARQTGGRGRGANRWWSAEGALTFSLVIDTHRRLSLCEIASFRGAKGDPEWSISPNQWPRIALATGLAVCESLHALYPPGIFGLKWPNDVHLGGRKLSGILVESQTRGRIVIGAGINVNNSFVEAPPDVRDRATSLSDVAGESFDLTETLVAVIARIIARLEQLGDAQHSFAGEFRRYCALTGCMVRIEQPSRTIVGMCEGIDDDGALLVRTVVGVERVVSGTVANW